jgi:ABC-type phosphate transport system substrate-binding protein
MGGDAGELAGGHAGGGGAEVSGSGGSSGSRHGGAVGVSGGAGAGSGGAGAGTAGRAVLDGGGGEAGADGTSCEDETGFHGLGCYRCAPTEIVTLENACSASACTRFDDAKRLTLLDKDGRLPPLPAPVAANGGANAGGAGGTASSTGGTGGSGVGTGGTAGGAGSGKSCADLAGHGTVVYITGSSAASPFLQQIAQQLAAQNVYIVYESTGSCVGVDAVLNGTAMTTGPGAPASTATYWDSAASPGVLCDLPPEGVSADIGVSDVFAQSCAGFEFANLDALQVRDAHGPIQTMTFAVPVNSPYSEISAEAAYFAFGFGAAGGVRDASGNVGIWDDENYLFKRSATSGTQAMLAAAIGVPAGLWKGKAHQASSNVAASIQAAAQKQETANAALGILAADYIDTKNLRAQIRVLAFQDTAQHCAVFPDSSSTARDKLNVRDGHYPIWGPMHLLLRVDGQGKPLNASNRQAVTDIIGYLSGTKALPNQVQLLDLYAQSGLVPECAMRVTRSKDGGNIFPYQPTSPCSCLFDYKATGSTKCAKCTVQGDCGSGETCSQGYCER